MNLGKRTNKIYRSITTKFTKVTVISRPVFHLYLYPTTHTRRGLLVTSRLFISAYSTCEVCCRYVHYGRITQLLKEHISLKTIEY